MRLDDRPDQEGSLFTPELSVALALDPDPRFYGFLNVVLSRDFVLAREAGSPRPSEDVALEVKEAFAVVRPRRGGLSLQLGRQRFEDEREWLYDAELDSVRLRYEQDALTVELSASRDGLVRTDVLSAARRDRTRTYALVARSRLHEDRTLEGYAIVRDDPSTARRRPVFLGVRAHGELVPDLDGWLELAYAGGRDGASRIRGWGVDLGATYELPVAWKPTVILGLAFGSGDPVPDDGTDRNFRQTGLQENEGDFGGAASFKYYGEVLDPELSNIAIVTAGLGIRPHKTFSLDLVYHSYVQHRAAATLRGAGLDAQPAGRRRDLGRGVDFVVGLQELYRRVDAKAVLGYFGPGSAFPGATGTGWVVRAEVQVRF